MKTALITGASSGIGKALAYVYARENYQLVLVARRLDHLETIKIDIEQKYKTKVVNIQQDLSLPNAAEILHGAIRQHSITVDVLINNAGFGIQNDFERTEIVSEEAMINLNILTLTKLTKLFLTDMLAEKKGHIINIASTAAYQPLPFFAIYGATKSYVLNFTEAIAFELKNSPVNITAICPGATQSEFADVAKVSNLKAFVKGPSSEQLAEFTYKAMIKKKIVAIHGAMNQFLVFTLRFAPRSLVKTIAAGFFK